MKKRKYISLLFIFIFCTVFLVYSGCKKGDNVTEDKKIESEINQEGEVIDKAIESTEDEEIEE